MASRVADTRPAPRILIVEDDATIHSMLVKVLSEEGFEAAVAVDGETAHAHLAGPAPDLVLLDLHMPGTTGFDLLADIRRSNRSDGSFVPVIILTGMYTSRDDKVASLEAGADDFLPKPFDLVELLARVRSLLRVQELYKRSQFLATHDPLTRCYNRRYLMDMLDREIERHHRYGGDFSFLMLDLDHFKGINDDMGHEAGDRALLHIGFRLQDFFRAVDCVARLGGDEFAAVLPRCAAEEARRVGARLMSYLSDPENSRDLPPELSKRLTASVGIASWPEHADDKEALIRLADAAMYAAKRGGRNGFRIAEKGKK